MAETPACPFCDARESERVAQFGSQILTAQWRCRACGSYFEAVRDDFAPGEPPPAR
jgi:ribosomal protein L37AE/L43A